MNAVLNLLWICVAGGAVSALALLEWRCRPGASLTARCRRALAVFVVLIALLPTVSASDDFVRLAILTPAIPSQKEIGRQITAGASQKSALYLAQLSKVFENSQVSWPSKLTVTLGFFLLAGALFLQDRSRFLPVFASRAPPHSLSDV